MKISIARLLLSVETTGGKVHESKRRATRKVEEEGKRRRKIKKE
jgi:hypothetical protein